MDERKWREISVYFDDGTSVQLSRSDFDKLKVIEPILDALVCFKRMQYDVNRLLGEAED